MTSTQVDRRVEKSIVASLHRGEATGLCLDVSDRHAPRGFTAPWKAAACLADGQLPEGAAFGCCAGPYVDARHRCRAIDAFEEAQNQFRKGEGVTMLSVLDKVEAKGMAKGKADTARRMLIRGLPPEQIADYTDLPLEEIEALRNPQA